MKNLNKQKIVNLEYVKSWLNQFEIADQKYVVDLLNNFLFIDSNELSFYLKITILEMANSTGPIAIYSERELKKKAILFKQSIEKPRRASGTLDSEQFRQLEETGSEGLISQIVTELCRGNRNKLFDHAGPDKIRKLKVREVWLVTDFIGSGNRVKKYLDALWRVFSVCSWSSYNLIKFKVISYAVTDEGNSFVASHPSKPVIIKRHVCPTVSSITTHQNIISRYKEICMKYNPFRGQDGHEKNYLGYKNQGALIAFAHGVPNNIPKMFYGESKKSKWIPLFSGRTSTNIYLEANNRIEGLSLEEKLIHLRQQELKKFKLKTKLPDSQILNFIVLAALSKNKIRTNLRISSVTGLSILEVNSICNKLIKIGLITKVWVLTDQGRSELRSLDRQIVSKKDEYMEQEVYYPQMLRAP